MPKSKRSKLVTLSRVTKKTKEWKGTLINTIRSYVDQFQFIYLLRYENLRNDKLKELREELKPKGRFCFGSTKISKVALGRSASEEYQEGLAKLSEVCRGNVGLFFTDMDQGEVMDVFSEWKASDYARAGSKATEDFELEAGPLQGPNGPLPHTLEPRLRQHKLPVKLVRGVVELITDHTVCKTGQVLTPDQAAILRNFGVKMAVFRLEPIAVWKKQGGVYEELADVDMAREEQSDSD